MNLIWLVLDISGLGYAPNHLQPNVFMAVSLDAHETDEVHPKNKQLVCHRLALAAMNVAYGRREYPTRGPFPVMVKMEGDGNVVIKFDQVLRIIFMIHDLLKHNLIDNFWHN